MSDTVTDIRPAASGARARKTQPPSAAGDNVVDLLGQLTSQGAHLAQEQVALMQAEVREAATDIKQAIAAYAGAGVLGLAGLGVTLTGLGWWLGDAIDNIPLGIVIVGIVTLVVAGILYASARSKTAAAHLKPERTIRTVEHTPDIVTSTHTSTRV
jgi:hypothetical protein